MNIQAGSSTPDITTPGSSKIPTLIRLLHGGSVAHELIHVPMISSSAQSSKLKASADTKGDVEDEDMLDSDEDEDDGSNPNDVEWNADAYVTNANYHVKKMTFLLFINRKCFPPSLFLPVSELSLALLG